MQSKNWLVIKDDSTRTFEVLTADLSENAFLNKTIAMQRAQMPVTSVVLPVSARFASKQQISFAGYTPEDGLWNRLVKYHQQLIQRNLDIWDDD
jgi:hypothetical protein